MGRGRKPCCEKEGLKKGSWTQDEDKKLAAYIEKHGHGNWRALPKRAGLLRCGKSCRLRWVNYLRPDLKRGNLSNEEEETIIKLQGKLGNKWSKIAALLPGRTDNEIKNIWNTHLKRRLQLEDPNHSADDNTEQPPSSASSASTISCEGQRIGKTDQSENSTILDADEFMHIGALAEDFEIPVDQSLDKWCVLEDACSTNFPRETSYESMVALGDQLEDCLSSEYYPSSDGHQQAPSWGPQLWSPIDGDSNLFHYEFGGMVDQEEYNKDISSTDVVSTGEAETKRWFAYLEKELDLWD